MATIKDIAKAAGVSHGTVSNVLNKTGKVRAEKIRLVEETAKRLGYVRNNQAQMLRQGATNHVALIIPTLLDDRYRDLFMAIQLTMENFEVCVYSTDDIANKEEKLLKKLSLSKLTAIVTVSCLQGKAIEAYSKITCPVIAINRKIMDKYTISFDFYEIGKMLGFHVIEQGWKKISFFCSSEQQEDDKALFRGLKDTINRNEASVECFSSDTNLIINKAFNIIRDICMYDGIITADVLRAEAILKAAKFNRDMKCPDIISLCSSQAFPHPFIKTFEMDYGQMGAKAANMLINLLKNDDSLPIVTNMQAKGFSFSFPHLKKAGASCLTMLTLESPATTALTKIKPLFHELTGIDLKIIVMPHDDLYNHLHVVDSSFYYDLIRMDTAWLSEWGDKLYLPLEDSNIEKNVNTKNLISNTVNYSQADNTMYALPFDPSVQIFLYRSDLFEDATLSRLYYERYREPFAVPTTISQYQKVSEFFTKSFNPDSPTLYGTTITNGSALTAACDFLPYYLADNNEICDQNGKALIDTPAMKEALRQYNHMKKYVSPIENFWWMDSMKQFADGNVATTHTFSNHAAYIINSKQSNVVGKTGAAIIPGGHPLLGGGVLGICKYSKNVEMCTKFFQWYYTKDIASAMIRLGGTSPLLETYNSYENFSVFPWLAAAKKSYELGIRGSGKAHANGFSNISFEYALGSAIRNILSQTMTIDEALFFAQTMYDAKNKKSPPEQMIYRRGYG